MSGFGRNDDQGPLLQWLGSLLYVLFLYVVLPFASLAAVFFVGRWVFFLTNPAARQRHLDQKAKIEEEKRQQEKAQRYAAEKATQRKIAERERKEREKRAERERKERERQEHRDADEQSTPYVYQIGRHGNESLAIRYGIANQKQSVKKYWYHAPGGERKRNPDRDKIHYHPADTIRLRKIAKISKDLYDVVLVDYRDRKARAIIETGTEYVKTFYPMSDDWFKKHAELENVLKGNPSFSLKELATFHVQKAL